MAEQADKVSHASLNGIYIKAQELDRGHNEFDVPACAPPGAVGEDAQSHASDASTHASACASDVAAHASDAETHASSQDAQTHASDC